MEKEKGEIYQQGKVLPLGIANPESWQGMGVAWDELEAAFCNGLEPQCARVTGADNVPIFNFKKMAVLVGERAFEQSSQRSSGLAASRGLAKRRSVAKGMKPRADATAPCGDRNGCAIIGQREVADGCRQQFSASSIQDQAPPDV
jgi:hypothetical protein